MRRLIIVPYVILEFLDSCKFATITLTLKAPNTTIAEFSNTVDSDETAYYEPSHLNLQCCLVFFEFSTKCSLNFLQNAV